MIMARHPVSVGKNKKNASGVLTGLLEEMKTLGRSGRRWKDNIRTELCGFR